MVYAKWGWYSSLTLYRLNATADPTLSNASLHFEILTAGTSADVVNNVAISQLAANTIEITLSNKFLIYFTDRVYLLTIQIRVSDSRTICHCQANVSSPCSSVFTLQLVSIDMADCYNGGVNYIANSDSSTTTVPVQVPTLIGTNTTFTPAMKISPDGVDQSATGGTYSTSVTNSVGNKTMHWLVDTIGNSAVECLYTINVHPGFAISPREISYNAITFASSNLGKNISAITILADSSQLFQTADTFVSGQIPALVGHLSHGFNISMEAALGTRFTVISASSSGSKSTPQLFGHIVWCSGRSWSNGEQFPVYLDAVISYNYPLKMNNGQEIRVNRTLSGVSSDGRCFSLAWYGNNPYAPQSSFSGVFIKILPVSAPIVTSSADRTFRYDVQDWSAVYIKSEVTNTQSDPGTDAVLRVSVICKRDIARLFVCLFVCVCMNEYVCVCMNEHGCECCVCVCARAPGGKIKRICVFVFS